MFDVFICHASEDKEEIARPLAEALSKKVEVWYDEFSLTLGDSLRESIDKGLSNSRFGVVILSKNFFEKNWSQKELNGLFAREVEGNKVILPVWHKITKEEVTKYSPLLADKIAVSTDKGLDEVISQILNAMGLNNNKKTSDSKSYDINKIIESIKKDIRNDDYISFNETLKKQMKILETEYYKIYDITEEDPIISFKEFEKYNDTITAIGLVIIEYYEICAKSNVDYFKKYLDIFQKIYNFPELLREKMARNNDNLFNLKRGYIPRAAIHNLYYYLGAFALKTEKFGVLNHLFRIQISEKDFQTKGQMRIWSLLRRKPITTFNRKPADIFAFLVDSYDYKDFLNEFFNSRNDFLKYLSQFNFILCLYGIKYGLENPDASFTDVYPNFTIMEGYINELTSKMKSDSDYVNKLSYEAFNETPENFKNIYFFRCLKLREELNEIQNLLANLDHDLGLDCNLFIN